jgi:hypothetical protein
MDLRSNDSLSPLEYATPTPQRTPQRVTGARRLALAFVLALVHWCLGFAIVIIFNNTRFINAAVLLFLFPFGWAAMRVNPHEMSLAAIGNSIFCGFAVAYAVTAWRNRRGSSR